ncbi:MAG: hypothetical protein ABEI11_01255 [Haloarculaceae archaeon]
MSETTPRERTGPATDATDDPAGADATADAETADAGGRETLRARLGFGSGSSGSDPDAVEITCYVVTGEHGGLTIPESFCRECHLFVRAADVAAERADAPVEVRVVSWYTHVLGALRHGGYHPPVMVIDGKRLSQGHAVPSVEEVVAAIEAAAER